jgi:hypothetical protein
LGVSSLDFGRSIFIGRPFFLAEKRRDTHDSNRLTAAGRTFGLPWTASNANHDGKIHLTDGQAASPRSSLTVLFPFAVQYIQDRES